MEYVMTGTGTLYNAQGVLSVLQESLTSCFCIPPNGYVDQKQQYDEQEYGVIREESMPPTKFFDADINDECVRIMTLHNFHMPTNKKQGFELYFRLLEEFNILPN